MTEPVARARCGSCFYRVRLRKDGRCVDHLLWQGSTRFPCDGGGLAPLDDRVAWHPWMKELVMEEEEVGMCPACRLWVVIADGLVAEHPARMNMSGYTRYPTCSGEGKSPLTPIE